jgi:hypothetical protein
VVEVTCGVVTGSVGVFVVIGTEVVGISVVGGNVVGIDVIVTGSVVGTVVDIVSAGVVSADVVTGSVGVVICASVKPSKNQHMNNSVRIVSLV